MFKTHLGWCGAVMEGEYLVRFWLPSSKRTVGDELRREFPDAEKDEKGLQPLIESVRGYFSGKGLRFRPPLRIKRESAFTRKVLLAVRNIPYGEVLSYGEVARKVGRPRAAREVGGVMHRNPIPLFIPCHRVVASGGKLGGFSAEGGLRLKKRMLALEK